MVIGVGIAAFALPGFRGEISALAATTHPIPKAHARSLANASQPATSPPATPLLASALLASAPVSVDVPGFLSWALLDRRTNAITGSANYANETSTTESMVKTWLAADYLRRLGDSKPDQDRLDELSTMIRDSDNAAADDIYQLDGADQGINRMISICGLTGATASDGWSTTEISAQDATRLGLCLATGRAAGPTWTGWLLGEMRDVRGDGRFGIIDGLPPATAQVTSIKNGWTQYEEDDEWHVACLAVHDDWVLAVLTRYPLEFGLSFGARVCKSVAQQLQAR